MNLNIFIGYDSREPVAYAVLAHSILTRASLPVTITPLVRSSLSRIYTRPRGPTESTEFSMTRFLVPYLSNYKGHSVFMDCDMLCQVDILDLWLHVLADSGRSVWCCQHDYTPSSTVKFLNQQQTAYPRKNWSSFMIFDNARCSALTPDYVNTASGLELHRFAWLAHDVKDVNNFGSHAESDPLIGSLPLEWNWLVGDYEPNTDAKVLHFTNGTPCFGGTYEAGPEAHRWLEEYQKMVAPMRVEAFHLG